MQEKFKQGERVKHETKTEWGIGEILADESNGNVRIFFEDVGAKVFDLSHPSANFVKLSHEESDSDYLSALVKYYQAELAKPTSLKKSDSKFTSVKNAIQIFLSYFSSGFQDCKYLDGRDGERSYKVAANQLMIELLDQDIFKILLDRGEFEEICSRAKRVVSKTNLINRYEIIWLSNGISIEGNQQAFAESLFDLLYGKNEIKDRF